MQVRETGGQLPCSQTAHDQNVLALGRECVSAHSGGRVRMWAAVGALAAKP